MIHTSHGIAPVHDIAQHCTTFVISHPTLRHLICCWRVLLPSSRVGSHAGYKHSTLNACNKQLNNRSSAQAQ